MKKDLLMYFDLITSIKTVNEVDNLSQEIDIMTSAFFTSQKTSLDKAMTSISTTTAKKIMDIFSKNNLDPSDKELVSGFFETIKKMLKQFKIIHLVLAFDPSLSTIENIHSFIKNKIGIGYILDIEVSESILGGAIVIVNGKYNDFTLKKTIEETFEQKRKEIYERF